MPLWELIETLDNDDEQTVVVVSSQAKALYDRTRSALDREAQRAREHAPLPG